MRHPDQMTIVSLRGGGGGGRLLLPGLLAMSAMLWSEQSYILSPAAAQECDCACEGMDTGSVACPGTDCASYAQCARNKVISVNSCNSLIFDSSLNQCNWAYATTCPPSEPCDSPTRRPTLTPKTAGPTLTPTLTPTEVLSEKPTLRKVPGQPSPGQPSPGQPSPGRPSPSRPPPPPPSSELPKLELYGAVYAHLTANKIAISNNILRMARRHPNSGGSVRTYKYLDFLSALRYMVEEGYEVLVPLVNDDDDENSDENSIEEEREPATAREVFYLGEAGPSNNNDPNSAVVGLVNLAAFLSQATADTLASGSCDEINYDPVNGALPVSNACGQRGMSYEDMSCPDGEEDMECPLDNEMTTRAEGGTVPFYCGPRSTYSYTGAADYISGEEVRDYPWTNRLGRSDVEGCCWWGRGAVSTRGRCQYGKLNHYLGAKAATDGRPTRWGDVDFCYDPGRVCSSEHRDGELQWAAGLFRWVDAVQSYDDPRSGWNYLDRLRGFVDGGMVDGSFFHGVSGIVTQGCHDPPCGTRTDGGGEDEAGIIGAEMRDSSERWEYFRQACETLGLPIQGGTTS